jgi:endonuclease I
MYSDIPGGTAPYLYTFVTDQCGSYSTEGDCYNREHSVPSSWFSDASPMYSELFHIVPTDGYVNNRRSNYPFGDVASASWTSQNGSKLGSSAVAGYTGTVFEPIDSFKGDFARIYFYMVTRYKDELPSWTAPPFTGSDFTVWAKNLFLQWDALDPVSAKEKIRNNKAYLIQHNRNPYVDHPEWVQAVWGPSSVVSETIDQVSVNVFPNPANNLLDVTIMGANSKNSTITLFQLDGKQVSKSLTEQRQTEVDLSGLPEGVYLLNVQGSNYSKFEKVVVIK